MKKTLVLLLGVILLNSCVSTEEKKKADALDEKVKEMKCRADLSKMISENGTNIMALATEVGLSKELEDFNKLASDSTVNCADRTKAWSSFTEKVLQAAN